MASASALQFQAKVALLRSEPNAQAMADQTLALYEEAFGANHPQTAEILSFMSQGAVVRGDFARGEVLAKRTLAILENAFGPDHLSLSAPLNSLGFIAARTGRMAEARGFSERSVAVLEKGKDAMRLGASLGTLADIVSQLDGLDAARPIYTRMLTVLEAAVGKEHPSYVRAENAFAAELSRVRKCDEAEPYIAHSLAYFEKKKRPDQMTSALVILGQCRGFQNRNDEAIDALERVVEICGQHRCEPSIGISARALLGELLVEGGKRARGVQLLREAHAEFVAKGMKEHVAEMEKDAKKLGVTF